MTFHAEDRVRAISQPLRGYIASDAYQLNMDAGQKSWTTFESGNRMSCVLKCDTTFS